MAASVDPLVVGRVIGDVVDMFVPTINMSVYYGAKHVTNGCDVKPSLTVNPPKVTLSGHPDEFYTLVFSLSLCLVLTELILQVDSIIILFKWIMQVMTDPDAPSPSEPSMREWVHW